MIWSLLSAVLLLGIVAAVFHANAQDEDPAYRIHRRQQKLLRDHSRAMKLWKKRGKLIRPNKEWIA